MADKKNPKLGILISSVYAGVCGVGLDFIAPMFMDDVSDNNISRFLKILGILGATYYGLTWSKFDRIFINTGLGIDNIYPIQKSAKKGDKSTYYKFTLPTGMSVSEFEKKKEHIEQHFGKKIEISYLNHGLFGIEMFHDTTAEMYDYDDTIEVDGDLAFPMGYDLHGKLVTCNLRCDDNCHMLIGSTSGGGKSVLLRDIITYLITHKNVELYLMDLKSTEFPIFEKCGCVKDVCYEPERAIGFLQGITKVMKHRYEIFRNNNVRDIDSYNQKHKKTPMKHIAVIIDEFSELMEDDASQRELERLSALSRASGIHLIISTQRPDSKIISSRIK